MTEIVNPFQLILERLERIEEKLNEHKPELDELLTVEEAAAFLHLTVQTIYGKIRTKSYPFVKKGKRVYFLKSDLMAFLKEDKSSPEDELNKKVKDFLTRRRANESNKA